MPPKSDLTTQLRQRADTLEVYRLSPSTLDPIAVDAGSVSQPYGVGAQAYQ